MVAKSVYRKRNQLPDPLGGIVCVAVASWMGFVPGLIWADGPLPPDEALAALNVRTGLEAVLFASEPMITNPTNIAVDTRGRVWVCDVVNYRGNNGRRPEGDRILILEDSDHDGQADRSTVFYQGRDINSAMGICLLGDCVLVSCSPYVWMMFDDDGDDRADRKEALFAETGLKQHDHSAHAFVYGPDGKLYWNLGNTNKGVFDRSGQVVLDRRGREIRPDGQPFRQGMAFRCNQDGSEMEVLAHNLRNSYELTVDAFGGTWFSDNDDDGNQGTRICYTLDGGNYGYTDELTGKGWRDSGRIGMDPSIPRRHWHQNDPGSIPNVFLAGSGSPSGITIYEGSLLGPDLRGAVIHCEPGHCQVRVFMPRTVDSGYEVDRSLLIDGRRDPWFRPVDVAAAPDGALMIADWYDPGVGGHAQGDIERGRIYRVAPPGAAPAVAPFPEQLPTKWAAALASPNEAVRRTARQAIVAARGPVFDTACDGLVAAIAADDSRIRARALWLLAELPGGRSHLKRAAADADENFRITALRASRIAEPGVQAELIGQLVADPSSQVRRVCAVEMQRLDDVAAAPLWARLAQQHRVGDRWMLEALGLAADGRWDACLDAWNELAQEDFEKTAARREIIWRSRGSQTFKRLVETLADSSLAEDEVVRLLRALDFNEAADRDTLLTWLAEQAASHEPARRALLTTEALGRLRAESLDDRQKRLLKRVLSELPIGPRYLDLVTQFGVAPDHASLLAHAAAPATPDGDAMRIVQLLLLEPQVATLTRALGRPGGARLRIIRLLAESADVGATSLLWPVAVTEGPTPEARREAIRGMAANRGGAERLVALGESGQLDEQGMVATAYALRLTPWKELKHRAAALCPSLPDSDAPDLPVLEWMQLKGVPDLGRQLFFAKANCASCHKVAEEGKNVGPALTEIGSKLSRTAMYEAVLYPSAAISHNYETYLALTEAGTAVTGLLMSATEDAVTLRTDKGIDHHFQRSSLESFERQSLSLMPAHIERTISPQELADLIAYLSTLKKSDQRLEDSSQAP